MKKHRRQWAVALPFASVIVAALIDAVQRDDPVRRIYPLFGRLPSLLRYIRDVMRISYREEAPFSEPVLHAIRQRAAAGSATSSFGSVKRPYSGEPTPVAVVPADLDALLNPVAEVAGCLEIPIVNFGALGFGPVSDNVIRAFGSAATSVGCLFNSGEDGLIYAHEEFASQLIWQLGTGLWGCSDNDFNFSPVRFSSTVERVRPAMIEVKLSQGAKPGAGGLMPAAKNTRRVARLLGTVPGQDIISPARHKSFKNVPELGVFVNELRRLSSLPVGIKLAVGSRASMNRMFESLASSDSLPDFITVDGGEGGTGAGPTVLQDYAGQPAASAVTTTLDALEACRARARVAVFVAGAVSDGYDVLRMLKYGADGVFMTRAPMIAIGCVQARECHTGTCPSGIATQSWWRRRAIHPPTQGAQLASYYNTLMADITSLVRASGEQSVSDFLSTWDIQ